MTTTLGTLLPRQRTGQLYLYVAAGAAVVTAIPALRGNYGWGLTEAFGGIAVSLFVLPWLTPRRRETVQIDDSGVLVETRKGSDRVLWSDVSRIRIVTTSGGPWSEDVYFVLDGKGETGCLVPHDAAVRTKLIEELHTRFTNVDDKKIIAAMGCTNDNNFVIWEAPPDQIS